MIEGVLASAVIGGNHDHPAVTNGDGFTERYHGIIPDAAQCNKCLCALVQSEGLKQACESEHHRCHNKIEGG